ncbi:hypothetical protein [Pedobacter antarcticus]|uniref:hypothetical protein n=1 Tax=Pedobacter antarcticus TaxID=34086 RepID=UPI00292FB87A|nr:hypothetical protein [Pedobacter antarcticus]
MAYNQEQKNTVREETLKNAIEALTNNEKPATLIDKGYVRRVRDFLLENGSSHDKSFASKLSDDALLKWENYFELNNRTKNVGELKVAYFSGPNPENDIRVLNSLGILPENVWAFESENRTYTAAVVSALESEFPYIKIHKGKIQNFLDYSPIKFDILYLDFCGTIISFQTLPVVTSIFAKQALNSPGVIITNFAYPNAEKNPEQWLNTIKLGVNYLYPKPFTESFEGLGGDWSETPSVFGYSPEDLLEIGKENPYNIYSQFITRVIMDLGSYMVPVQRFTKSLAWKLFFNKPSSEVKLTEDFNMSLVEFPDSQPIVSGLSDLLPFKDGFSYDDIQEDAENIDEIMDDKFGPFLSKFAQLLSVDSNAQILEDYLKKMAFLMDENNDCEKYYSEALKKISENWDWESKHIFCDVFLFHQMKDLLVRQLSIPYHYNIDASRRWVYQAKETPMFQDIFVFDECRYLYDWMPTIDMFENSVTVLERQLILRFILDGLSKHRFYYNSEFLGGTAVVSNNVPGFEVRELTPRVHVQ